MEKWMVYALISMVFAGLTSVVAKFGMSNMSSDSALAVRTAVVFTLVTVNAFLFKNAFTEIRHSASRDLWLLAFSGLCTTISWVFYYRAMKEGPVSYVASIDKASIVVTLMLSFILLREPVTGKVLLGAALVFAGLLVLVWK
ncbi:EamA family transporter [Salmonirosea aquatica]|uniref:EamA family transporter n=1 Tax=Salmonirosea aquatica TaxID=2654236 RepID=A0A7C9BB05_9BACT|nr:EamA family transporter [Cytophagaceae bacterium SJW1-29]